MKLMTADEIINNNSRRTKERCQTYLVIDSTELVKMSIYVYIYDRLLYTSADNNIPFKTVKIPNSPPLLSQGTMILPIIIYCYAQRETVREKQFYSFLDVVYDFMERRKQYTNK